MKNLFLRLLLSINRHLSFSKPFLLLVVTLLPSEPVPKLETTWRIFQRSIYFYKLTYLGYQQKMWETRICPSLQEWMCYIELYLTRCTNAIVKTNKYSEIHNLYLNLKRCCGHEKKIFAISRIFMTILSHMLNSNKNYNAEFHRKLDLSSVNLRSR